MKKLIFLLAMVLSLGLAAQDKTPITEEDYANSTVEMADGMRASGKIYVLVAIIMVVFAGIVFYLVATDRRITRLEKEFGDHQ